MLFLLWVLSVENWATLFCSWVESELFWSLFRLHLLLLLNILGEVSELFIHQDLEYRPLVNFVLYCLVITFPNHESSFFFCMLRVLSLLYWPPPSFSTWLRCGLPWMGFSQLPCSKTTLQGATALHLVKPLYCLKCPLL